MRLLIAIIAVVLLTGCHESGTWKDDPKNWKRIFKSEKPADIKVVHSQVWRSPHFTYEVEYFFQIEKPGFPFRTNSMKEVLDLDELHRTAAWSDYRPEWFVPKDVSRYQVWIFTNEGTGNFRLLIDRDTGDFFLSDRQL